MNSHSLHPTSSSETSEPPKYARFPEERKQEYSGIIMECHKALKHIEREYQLKEFKFEEVEELEGDLEKIKRWFVDIKKRDFWDAPARQEAESLMSEVEANLTKFTQKTYEEH